MITLAIFLNNIAHKSWSNIFCISFTLTKKPNKLSRDNYYSVHFSSVAQLCLILCDPMDCSKPGFSITGACSDPCPSSRWCHPTIVFSVVPFSFCLQSSQALGSFPKSQFFASGGQSIGTSTSASALPRNTQDWLTLGLTSLIFLQPKGLSRVFSSPTVQKHQFFSTQLSLWSNTHIHASLLEKP